MLLLSSLHPFVSFPLKGTTWLPGSVLLVPTGWNWELTAPHSATGAHNRLILVFLVCHVLLHNSQSLKCCKVKTKLWVPETFRKTEFAKVMILFQTPEKSFHLLEANYPNAWLKVADKDHQNDLRGKTKNTFPPIHGCTSSESTGTVSLIKHYRFLQKTQWRPFLRDHLKLMQTKTERTRQNSKQTSITNIIFGHYHCIYTAYQTTEETVAKILMGQSPFRNAFPQSGNFGISIDNLMLLLWLEGKKLSNFMKKEYVFIPTFQTNNQ